MIKNIKTMLGDRAANYTDAQIELALQQSIAEVEDYCGRELDRSLELISQRIAVIKLNRIGTEGAASQSFSGVSESYLDGYPADIKAALNRKRKIKVV
jgi:hypothetical protein